MKGHGLRSRTRDLFSRAFRKKGYIPLGQYLRTFRVGDYVDIKANAAVQKGMPFKFYHGRTGRIWNVAKRSLGVEMNKQPSRSRAGAPLTRPMAAAGARRGMQVGNRIIKKRIHVRLEHVVQSRCHEEFLERRKRNDELKAEAKKRGEKISTKRQPAGPKPGFIVEGQTLHTMTAVPYDIVTQLKGGY
eukprot:SM000004S14964  [mRNA]  locus=s4:471325:472094:- [translate_table: standard]